MAPDRGRRGHGASGPDASPVDQLETWRTWRHDDTAELPVVPAGHDDGYATEEFRDQPDARRRRRRPGTGLLVGAGLLLAALAVSGLAAAGVGPVAHLLGSGDGKDRPTGTTGTSGPEPASGTATGSGSTSSGTTSTGGSAGGSSDATSSESATPGRATAPSAAAPAPGGAAPTGAVPGPAGSAAPGPGGPGAAGGHHGTPPQPPAGGPGG